MANQHDQLLSDLVKFIADASHQLHGLAHTTGSNQCQTAERRPPPSRLEIPTAVVVAGHGSLPGHLASQTLEEREAG